MLISVQDRVTEDRTFLYDVLDMFWGIAIVLVFLTTTFFPHPLAEQTIESTAKE